MMHSDFATDEQAQPNRHVAAWLGVMVALVFPTIVTWAYFYQAAATSEGVQRTVMATLKGLQFAFPVLWTWCVLKQPLRWQRLSGNGVAIGLVFGLAVAASGWFVYRYALASSPPFVAAVAPIRAKIAGFGLDSLPKYITLAVFYSLAHSLLEEYYWRWFVFGQLRRLLPLWPAIVVSAVGFVAHHVLVLSMYFGWWSWPTALFSAAVAFGGGFWAWLYDRSGSLVGPWLSHMLVDAGVFLVGFHLVREMLS